MLYNIVHTSQWGEEKTLNDESIFDDGTGYLDGNVVIQQIKENIPLFEDGDKIEIRRVLYEPTD